MIAKSLGAFPGAGFSTIPVNSIEPIAGLLRLDDAIFRDFAMRHLEQRDDRRVVLFGDIEQLPEAGLLRIDDVVGQEYRERLVADRLVRLKHRMAEPERLRPDAPR